MNALSVERDNDCLQILRFIANKIMDEIDAKQTSIIPMLGISNTTNEDKD
jgi:hypothetical protein